MFAVDKLTVESNLEVENLAIKYCPRCGRRLATGANFCPFCGYQIFSLKYVRTFNVLGVLGIISLLVPWELHFSSDYFAALWLLFYYVNFEGRTFFGTVLEYPLFFVAVNIATFLMVLVGSVLLVTRYRSSKIGPGLILSGVLIRTLEFTYYIVTWGLYFALIPVGWVLATTVSMGSFFLPFVLDIKESKEAISMQ